MPIQINTVKPQIQLEITEPKMHIEQTSGELSIRTTDTEMVIDKEMPKVKIDQYQCFAEAGLKNNRDLSKEFAQLGYQKAMEAISNIVSEGDTLMNIQYSKGNTIALIAKSAKWGSEKEFNFDMIPKSRPKISVEGHLEVNWNPGKVDINYTPKSLKINFQRGKVEVYLNQKPNIDIRYIDDKK